jgi:predicted dehydrogenase
MSKVFNVGIIGCGWIALDKHIPSMMKQPDAKIAALCDVKVERAAAAAKQFGLTETAIYGDYKELLADKSIDIVHICTPNPLHCDMTVEAFKAGKHVLCEKPLATTAADAQRMIDAAKKAGKKLTVGYQWRYRQEALYIKNLCDKGYLGEIYYAKAHATRYRATPTWGEYIGGNNGGGVLIDGAPHALDLTLWAMNNYKPKSVKANIYNKMAAHPEGNIWEEWKVEDFKVEDSGFAIVTMENGATIYVEASWLINMVGQGDMKTTLCGTEAGVDMFNKGGVRINRILNGKPIVIEPDMEIPAPPGVILPLSPPDREAREWLDCIKNDTEPFIKAEEALVVTQIIEGIYESARTGKEIFFA